MIEFVKFGLRLVYWPPTLTGNINFKLKIFVKYGIRTHAHFRIPDLKSDALNRSANLTNLLFIFSFIFSVKTSTLNKDLASMNNGPENKFWDFSTLHPDHELYDESSKNELGLFKLETCDYISGMVGARPKVYSFETIPFEDFMELMKKGPFCVKVYKKKMKKKVKNVKRCKGVKKFLIRQQFTHQCYKCAVLKGELKHVAYFTIASRKHEVTTDLRAKLGLSRYVCFFLHIKN